MASRTIAEQISFLPTIRKAATSAAAGLFFLFASLLPWDGNGAASKAEAATLNAEGVTATTAALKLTGHSGDWYYKYTSPDGGSCSDSAVTGTTASLAKLIGSTTYTFAAYSDSNCATLLATAVPFTTLRNVALTASAITETSATLTVVFNDNNHPYKLLVPLLGWYHKTGSTCTYVAPASGKTVRLSDLGGGTSYTYTGHFQANCSDDGFASETFTTVSFRAGRLGATSATLAIGNYDAAWWYKGQQQNADCAAVDAGTATGDLTGLTPSSSYVYTAYKAANCAAADKIADAEFTTPAVSLAAGAVEAATATLTIEGHSGAWRYKHTGQDAACSSEISTGTKTASIASLSTGTGYTFKAYSDSACNDANLLATAPAFVTKPGKVAGVQAAARNGALQVSWAAQTGATSYKVQWKSGNQNFSSVRQATAAGTAKPLASLNNGTAYSIRVAAANATGDGAWSEVATGTPLASASTPAALTAGNIGAKSATLTIANHTGNWHYKYTSPDGGACSANAVTGATATAASLTAATAYTFAAYSDSACNTEIATASAFTTLLAKVAGVTVKTFDQQLHVAWTAQRGAAHYQVQWKSGNEDWSFTRQSIATGKNTTIPSLTNGTQYSIRVRQKKAGKPGEWSAEATGTPNDETLTVTDIGTTTAKLTIGNWHNAWRYKASNGSCSSEVAADTAMVDLANLKTGTRYTFSAYSGSNCSTLLATASAFTTRPGKVANVQAAARHTALAVGWDAQAGATSYKIQWKSAEQEWDAANRQQTSTTASKTLTPLVGGTTYTVRVAAATSGGDGAWSDEVAGTPFTRTLTAAAAGATSITLTIGGHTGNWHYKHAGGSCSTNAVAGATATATGLTADTAYVFAAYSDSSCTTAIAVADSAATLLAKVADVAAAARHTALHVTWTAQTGADGYDVQWKSGSEKFSSGRQSGVTTNSARIPDLINGTVYTVRVRQKKTAGSKLGEWSAETTGTPAAATLAASAIRSETATLTIGNYGGSWHYKYTAPSPGGTCASAGSGATAGVTGLTADRTYTFKAYSDSACSTVVATAPDFTTLLAKVAGVTAAARDSSLHVSWDPQTGATGYDVQWKSGTQEFSSSRQSGATGTSATIPGLVDGKQYTVRARAKKAGKLGEWSDTATGTPADETLTASDIGATSATLTIGNYGGAWRYKHTSGNCSGQVAAGTASATVGNLTSDTTYNFRAYSDNGCTTELAAAAAFTTLLPKVAGLSVSPREGWLSVSWTGQPGATGYDLQWKSGTQGWSSARQTSTSLQTNLIAISNLDNGVEYTLRIRSKKTSGGVTKLGEWSATATGTPNGPTLSASNVEATTATITINNYGLHTVFRYKRTAPSQGTCKVSPSENPSFFDLGQLTPGTSYSYRAFNDATCQTGITPVLSFLTKPGKVAGVKAAARDRALAVSWTARTGAASYKIQWKSGVQNWTASREATSTTASKTLGTLTNSTTYTIRVAAVNATGDGAWSDAATATPADETLAASDIGTTSATLTIGNYGGAWHYKHTGSNATCVSVMPAGAATARAVGLMAGTAYTFKAYSDACATLLTTAAEFTTKPGKVSGVKAAARDGALAVSWDAKTGAASYRIQWKSGVQNWTASRETTSTTASKTLGTLTNSTTYTIRVAAVNATGDGAWSDAATATPADETLAASDVGATSATLTIGNYGGAWHYKHTGQDAACSPAVSAGTAAASAAGLMTGTTYTFKAYSDSNCATLLATAADFTTKPGKVAGVKAAARDGALAVSWTAETGAASYRIQWKSGGQTWNATRETTSTTASKTLGTLANSTTYTIRVAAANATGDGAWSDAATGTPADETLAASDIGTASATLTIGNYGGAWHYKHTGQDAACSPAVSAGTAAASAVGLMTGTTYTFKAYSDSNCATLLATAADFTTLLAKVANVTATAGSASLSVSWTAQPGADGYDVQWKSGSQGWSSGRQSGVTTNSATISKLAANTQYTIRVRSKRTAGGKLGEWSDTATGTPEGLGASGVTSTGATLTLTGHTGNWYVKGQGGGSYTLSCTATSGSAHSVAGLQGNTSYVFEAHSASDCSGASRLATAYFTTPGSIALLIENITKNSMQIHLRGHDGSSAWSYLVARPGDGSRLINRCFAVSRGQGVHFSPLSPGTEYAVAVYRSSRCEPLEQMASASFTTLPVDAVRPSLSHSNVTGTSATLTLANHAGVWWYDHDRDAASCTQVAAQTASVTVSGLQRNTNYTFTAYSEAGCWNAAEAIEW